jgi:hypothetical protein
MPKKLGQVPTLSELIRTTTRLRRDLTNLMKRHPEGHVDLGNRIFVRLLNPMWRNPFGKTYTPEQQKQTEAVEWIGRYQNYIRDLAGLLGGVLGKPEVFAALPLHELPIAPPTQFSAEECLRRLELQEAALRRLAGRGEEHLTSDKDTKLANLRARLSKVIDEGLLAECSFKTGLHRDTISDVSNGRTIPRGNTVEKLEQYLRSLKSRRD